MTTRFTDQDLRFTRGFTLIEMLVSISIFTIVVIIAVGALLHLTRASDHSQAILAAINNLDFAMEQMSRTMRVGTSFYCSNSAHPVSRQARDCPFGQERNAVSFTDQDGRRLVYKLNTETYALERENLSEVPRRIFSITAPEIKIENLTFAVIGSQSYDNFQPLIVINIKARTAMEGFKEEDQVSFNLQTAISQREPDL
ncbi:MAG TPA: prepilin-type N-terminal cleavage/methylation domain-containing protein [Candidatus Paceibacterota bacterium]